ncbi:DNA-binding transcriptional regulator, LysR family [Tissierella praeacuta DSM 18095]|uniref:DNA-binding transcriptional regulator, LysR family n=1 Tax=Tissierella praeacuta DSM 18095 TaxID=1123404 RepID=A0A1M4TH58_9FIRM|nr:LysR family transcriptional regulator [Tissierella praeacuta]SHE43849.1 DNA-binding transcriptional regulator, LysR family [Tissierella praeacuta DSM 18095]SUP04631.1 Cyn operon transcriptional activator [Tissierella praeacuta]
MSIRLELYRIFDKVAKCKSFSKAANELYMTQPAISQAIMQLEDELKIRLFTRTPRGVILTNEGKILFEYTNSAISLLDNGEKKIRQSRDLKQGELKIGVSDTISRYYLLPYVEKFHKDYPNIKLKIINQTTDELCKLIKSGEIDIGICNLPIKDNSLDIKKCKDIQDIFVFGERYKDMVTNSITYEELLGYPLIFLDNRSKTRQYVEGYLFSKGIRINPEIELGSHDLLLEFAKVGLGLACVVREFSKNYLLEGSLYELNLVEDIPKRGIGICSLKGVSLSPSSEKFIEYLDIK